MFWLIVLIILILIIHSMLKATTGVAKAVGKGVAHDMSQINAELTNKTTITNYLDYLVNCKGWKKSGTLLVIYEAPNGKTGSYIQWEQRIMANHKATDVLSNAEVAAFFQMYDAPIKKVGMSKTINTKISPKTENDYTKYTNWVYEHDKDDGSDPFGDDVDEHILMKFFECYRSKRKIYYEKNCSYLYEHSNDACYSCPICACSDRIPVL